jgi:hypothetical protein
VEVGGVGLGHQDDESTFGCGGARRLGVWSGRASLDVPLMPR